MNLTNTSEIIKSKLLIEAYGKIQDKKPLYSFKKDTLNDAVNLAEVLLEGKEIDYVVIVDEPTDTIIHEYKKH